MNYDGNTLSVESQQDNQPIKRKKYTLKQLRREIPVAAELIKKYLGGEIPKGLHKREQFPEDAAIYPVLPNPVDLGLIPPGVSAMPESSSASSMRRKYRIAEDDDAEDNKIIKLYVSEKGDLTPHHHHRNIGNLPFFM